MNGWGAGSAAVAIAVGAALSMPVDAATEVVIDRTLDPGRTREECVDAQAGARLDYAFQATGMVSFNVHHHVGRETSYDVERHRTIEADTSVVAPVDGRYCLTFTNEETRDVDIEGRYRLVAEADDR